MLDTRLVVCPYCGESFDTTVDLSAGSQQYIEDCFVCCRPINFAIDVDNVSECVHITVKRDDE